MQIWEWISPLNVIQYVEMKTCTAIQEHSTKEIDY